MRMRPDAPWPFAILCLILATAPTWAVDPPLGLTLSDLRAVRKAYHFRPEWLPALSPAVQTLLLDRSEAEVVQVILHPDGTCQYRGLTDRHLLTQSGTSSDYANLAQSFLDNYFRKTLELVEAVSSYLSSPNPVAFAQRLSRWQLDVQNSTAPAQEKEKANLLLGHAILELPEEIRKKVLDDPIHGRQLQAPLEKAEQNERLKLDAVRTGTVKPGQAAEARVLAGQLVHVLGDPGHPFGLPLKPAAGDKQLYTMEVEPGRKVFIQTDARTAKGLTDKTNPNELSQLARENKVRIYVDSRETGKPPTRIDPGHLQEQIKNVQSKRK